MTLVFVSLAIPALVISGELSAPAPKVMSDPGTGAASKSLQSVPVSAPGTRALLKVISPPQFKHEVWGASYRGDGYVYGPYTRGAGLTVVDIDHDNDNDFVVPGDAATDYMPQIFRNLGASGAFYPGALEDLDLRNMPASSYLSISMDFEDVNGDTLPDLLTVMNDYANSQRHVSWFQNVGTHDAPAFRFVEHVYTSSQPPWPAMWVDWADIDNDGLADLFFIEAFINEAYDHHRVFWIPNAGTSTTPSWNSGSVTAIPELTALLPERMWYDYKRAEDGQGDARDCPSAGDSAGNTTAKGGYTYALGDFEMADWNADGDLDFMFYDQLEGVYWIRNLGTAEAPEWDTALANEGELLYDHRLDGMTRAEGTLALRQNPDPVRRMTEWLDEFYLSAQGWLMTWRYFMTGGGSRKDYVHESAAYRLIQENSVSYASGQGPPALWDYDGDGDLDLFRSGVGASDTSKLLLFPNIGAPYAPAWGVYTALDDLLLSKGTVANDFRQDMYTFADHDLVDGADLFVQNQAGQVDLYWAYQADSSDTLPTFVLAGPDYGGIVYAGQTGVEPRGLALADFNVDSTGEFEMIAAYASDQGGKLVYYNTYDGTLKDISTFLEDDYGTDLWPNDIESLAAADLDRDGRPDLIVTLGMGDFYQYCSHYFYRNTLYPGGFYFDYAGRIDAPYETEPQFARMPAFGDIDADGDDDLFIGYQRYYPSTGSTDLTPYMRFYRNDTDTGLSFWRTRVVTGQTWRLKVGGMYPDYTFVVNASGGSIPETGKYTAGATARVVDILESSNDYRIFIDVLPEVTPQESKAVLVVGGDPNDALYPTFVDLASYAYWVLRNEGLSSEGIRLFVATNVDADDDGVSDRFASPTLSGLETAITDWAADTERLLVYFDDHGQRERFRLNATDYLDAGVYAGWIDTLQSGGAGPQVTTVIDTCEAGSFVDNLSVSKGEEKAEARRITITSSGIGPIEGLAMFDSVQDISFSLSFWRAIFNGETYGEAFDTAKVAIEAINPLQTPMIDDDGDGIPNEPNDGLLAQSERPGADFEVTLPGVFIVAFALRAFLRIGAVFVGIWALSIFVLAYLGWVEVHWDQIDAAFKGVTSNIGEQFQSFQTFVTGSLPSTGLAVAGLLAGFKWK